jgi:hypothetical protein
MHIAPAFSLCLIPRTHRSLLLRHTDLFKKTLSDKIELEKKAKEIHDTDSLASPAGCLGVLTAHPDSPKVPQTPVSTDLLQALQVFTELVVQLVGKNLKH